MVNIPRWQVVTVLVLCFLGMVFAVPNLFGKATMEGLPDWLPSQQISLGLDLQGGSHLLLEVDAVTVIEEDLEALVDEQIDHMAADKSGAPGNYRNGTSHIIWRPIPAWSLRCNSYRWSCCLPICLP